MAEMDDAIEEINRGSPVSRGLDNPCPTRWFCEEHCRQSDLRFSTRWNLVVNVVDVLQAGVSINASHHQVPSR